MTYPTFDIVSGPATRDLEMSFLARNLEAGAIFTIYIPDHGKLLIRLQILNFSFVTCHGPVYQIGGHAIQLSESEKKALPRFNFISASYNARERCGTMTFSNGG